MTHSPQSGRPQALIAGKVHMAHVHLACAAPAGAFVAVMTVFAAVCMAETSGVPLEAMRELWRSHWFWRGALALTGAGSKNPHGVESPHGVLGPGAPAAGGSHGGVPQKGWDGGLDGANGPSNVKRASGQARVNRAVEGI